MVSCAQEMCGSSRTARGWAIVEPELVALLHCVNPKQDVEATRMNRPPIWDSAARGIGPFAGTMTPL
jgi:hypothetical protein